jgi:hypothetical protein
VAVANLRPGGVIKLLGRKAGIRVSTLIRISTALVVGGVVTFLLAKDFAGHRDLLENGSRVTGTIMHKTRWYGENDEHYEIGYTFSTPDGGAITGSGDIGQGTWRSVEVGGQIGVAFDTENPSRNEPLSGEPISLIPLWTEDLAGAVFIGLPIALFTFWVSPVVVLTMRALASRVSKGSTHGSLP